MYLSFFVCAPKWSAPISRWYDARQCCSIALDDGSVLVEFFVAPVSCQFLCRPWAPASFPTISKQKFHRWVGLVRVCVHVLCVRPLHSHLPANDGVPPNNNNKRKVDPFPTTTTIYLCSLVSHLLFVKSDSFLQCFVLVVAFQQRSPFFVSSHLFLGIIQQLLELRSSSSMIFNNGLSLQARTYICTWSWERSWKKVRTVNRISLFKFSAEILRGGCPSFPFRIIKYHDDHNRNEYRPLWELNNYSTVHLPNCEDPFQNFCFGWTGPARVAHCLPPTRPKAATEEEETGAQMEISVVACCCCWQCLDQELNIRPLAATFW